MRQRLFVGSMNGLTLLNISALNRAELSCVILM